jgi:hypothetical protein
VFFNAFSAGSLNTTALVAVLLLAGCGQRAPQREIERMAVLPFENLSANPALDWIAMRHRA